MPDYWIKSMIDNISLPSNLPRPDPAVCRRNRAFLALCFGKDQNEKLKPLIDDLLKYDNGSWNSPQITHHCSGMFCCRSIAETRAKLENAIMVACSLVHTNKKKYFTQSILLSFKIWTSWEFMYSYIMLHNFIQFLFVSHMSLLFVLC